MIDRRVSVNSVCLKPDLFLMKLSGSNLAERQSTLTGSLTVLDPTPLIPYQTPSAPPQIRLGLCVFV